MTSIRTPKARLGRTGNWASSAIAAVVLLAFLVALPILSPAEAATTTTTDTAAMKAELAQKQELLDEAYKQWDAMQDKLNEVAAAYNEAESRAAELETEIADVENKITSSEQDLLTARIQLEERLVGIYKDGGAVSYYLQVFFSEDDLASVFEQLDALKQIADDDQALFDEVEGYLEQSRADKALLEQKKAEHAAQIVELQRLQADAEAELQGATAEYEAIKAQVTKLQAEIKAADARAAELARQKRLAAQRAAAAAAAAAAAKKSSSSSSSGGGGGSVMPGAFTFPVAGPHSYVDSWGAPRSGGRTHKGTDIMASRGTKLVACVDGTITQLNRYDTGLGGKTLYIQGSNGVKYYYAHCDSISSSLYVGKWVSAGTYVGTVGSTGNASYYAPHLHFGMIVNGTYVNPYPTLRANDN